MSTISHHTRHIHQVYENPLAEFVELPPQYQGLNYSNLLCGVIRGALEMVRFLPFWWYTRIEGSDDPATHFCFLRAAMLVSGSGGGGGLGRIASGLCVCIFIVGEPPPRSLYKTSVGDPLTLHPSTNPLIHSPIHSPTHPLIHPSIYPTQIRYRVECRFVKDTLKGDDVNEIRWVQADARSRGRFIVCSSFPLDGLA